MTVAVAMVAVAMVAITVAVAMVAITAITAAVTTAAVGSSSSGGRQAPAFTVARRVRADPRVRGASTRRPAGNGERVAHEDNDSRSWPWGVWGGRCDSRASGKTGHFVGGVHRLFGNTVGRHGHG